MAFEVAQREIAKVNKPITSTTPTSTPNSSLRGRPAQPEPSRPTAPEPSRPTPPQTQPINEGVKKPSTLSKGPLRNVQQEERASSPLPPPPPLKRSSTSAAAMNAKQTPTTTNSPISNLTTSTTERGSNSPLPPPPPLARSTPQRPKANTSTNNNNSSNSTLPPLPPTPSRGQLPAAPKKTTTTAQTESEPLPPPPSLSKSTTTSSLYESACKKCRSLLTPSDAYCKKCGAPTGRASRTLPKPPEREFAFNSLSLNELKQNKESLDKTNLELFLTDDAFTQVFGMTKEQFQRQSKGKQFQLKQNLL